MAAVRQPPPQSLEAQVAALQAQVAQVAALQALMAQLPAFQAQVAQIPALQAQMAQFRAELAQVRAEVAANKTDNGWFSKVADALAACNGVLGAILQVNASSAKAVGWVLLVVAVALFVVRYVLIPVQRSRVAPAPSWTGIST